MTEKSKEFQLDEAWIYGLIRQESRFIADAKSRVGAQGLMQLMPATAIWAAKQVGMKSFDFRGVNEVTTNLRLGSFYLRHVLDDLGHPVLATAAYNAGPSRARRWRAESPLEGAIYAESIPFNETRDYVKKVMVNKWFYLNRLGVENASLRAIMGVVPGKSAGVTPTPVTVAIGSP
jgi:soluble lytic murein transglycosylase